jgi:hypothetical protein
MRASDKATGRVVALIVLLVIAAAALRGYLPGAARSSDAPPDDSTTSLVAVVVMLGVSVAAVAIGVLASLRNPPRASSWARYRPPERWPRGRWRPTRRMVLIALGALLAWLVMTILWSRVGLPHSARLPAANTPSGTAPTVDVPPPPSTPPQGPVQPPHHNSVFGYLAAVTVMMLLLYAVSTTVAVRRRWRVRTTDVPVDEPIPVAPLSAPKSLTRAAEFGLAEIGDRTRGPREAIIACYAAMESALAEAPGAAPLESDTPSEVLSRAVQHHALHANSATELVDLFAEARFSPHVMTEEHRLAAERVLRRVLVELRSVA